MQDIDHEPFSATALLNEYLAEGRSEVAFASLVQALSGMVYASALRRTGSPQIAEEVAQNVFALLARRAESLRDHPSLSGWIFQTTRYQASRAMRAERRRERKLNALADERQAESQSCDAPAWRDALPLLDQSLDRLSDHERDLVLQRFFEGRKFGEIAAATGRTEAACKMGVKRALEKLSRLLTARGVALSGAAVGTCLTAEFAKGLPAGLLSELAPKALAAAEGLAAPAVVGNSLQTMGASKLALVASAVVLVTFAIPLVLEMSEGRGLERQLASLSAEPSAANLTALPSAINKSKLASEDDRATVGALLAGRDRRIDLDTFILEVGEGWHTEDIVGILRAMLPLSTLAPAEVEALAVELATRKGDPEVLGFAMELLDSFTDDDHASALERMAGAGPQNGAYRERLYAWAIEDLEGALGWVQAQRAAGHFEDKGLSVSSAVRALGLVLGVLAKTDVDRAFELMRAEPLPVDRRHLADQMAWPLAEALPATKEAMRELIAEMDPDERQSMSVDRAIVKIREAVGIDAAAEFAGSLDLSESHHQRLMVGLAAAGVDGSERFADALDWLAPKVPEADRASAMWLFVTRVHGGDLHKVDRWIDDLAPGETRDHVSAVLAEGLAGNGMWEAAVKRAASIGNAVERNTRLDRVLGQWVKADELAARKAAARHSRELD